MDAPITPSAGLPSSRVLRLLYEAIEAVESDNDDFLAFWFLVIASVLQIAVPVVVGLMGFVDAAVVLICGLGPSVGLVLGGFRGLVNSRIAGESSIHAVVRDGVGGFGTGLLLTGILWSCVAAVLIAMGILYLAAAAVF